MTETVRERYRRWELDELLQRYPGLRVAPTQNAGLKIRGELAFRVQGPLGEPLEDIYEVSLEVPIGFPAEIPDVYETGGRIPPDFHKLKGGSLCLGAPTAVRLHLHASATLITFVEAVAIPYLYGYSYFKKYGVMPYKELDHGPDGLRDHFASLFRVTDRMAAQEFVRLASLKRRRANKARCPCGSEKRLGRCHNRSVNKLRQRLGRLWFHRQYRLLTDE
jgi:hypothetical protein